MGINLMELSKLEHRLPNGMKLAPMELVIIELFRKRRGDAIIRDVTGLDQGRLIRVVAVLRGKLGCPMTETIREAADRLEIPRLPANGLTGKAE